MRYPYLVSSDQHAHGWSQFSKTDENGVNSRLNIILDELERAHDELELAGGCDSFLGGDLYHVRGKIEPSVFNPTTDRFAKILRENNDLSIFAIPGNHDLEGHDSDRVGNAMQSLESIERFNVAVETQRFGDVIVVPWHKDLKHLRAILAILAEECRDVGTIEKTDVIIHAPVNGVIKGIPDHGLEAQELAAYGFRRVFAGHYHDHKVFCDGKVISIGATTHQTWSDVGTLAGFLLVYEDRIVHFPSKAPQFVDLNKVMDEFPNSNPADFAVGHYARARLDDVTDAEINKFRRELLDAGCLGVNISGTKKVATGRSGAAAKAVNSLDASVSHYITHDLKPMLEADVSALALEILNEARS